MVLSSPGVQYGQSDANSVTSKAARSTLSPCYKPLRQKQIIDLARFHKNPIKLCLRLPLLDYCPWNPALPLAHPLSGTRSDGLIMLAQHVVDGTQVPQRRLLGRGGGSEKNKQTHTHRHTHTHTETHTHTHQQPSVRAW